MDGSIPPFYLKLEVKSLYLLVYGTLCKFVVVVWLMVVCMDDIDSSINNSTITLLSRWRVLRNLRNQATTSIWNKPLRSDRQCHLISSKLKKKSGNPYCLHFFYFHFDLAKRLFGHGLFNSSTISSWQMSINLAEELFCAKTLGRKYNIKQRSDI